MPKGPYAGDDFLERLSIQVSGNGPVPSQFLVLLNLTRFTATGDQKVLCSFAYL
jgi:hypothetical protein